MTRRLRVALIADAFPPQRTSGAVQVRDLSREFVRQGHDLTVLVPAAGLRGPFSAEDLDGVRVLRLSAPHTKGAGYVRRTLGELLVPFFMRRHWRRSPLAKEKWDAVVWYAPSIFLAVFAGSLKKASGSKAYLIIRDIFPNWAVDMGLMKRGLVYRFFDAVARYQYSVADVIGVQTRGNCSYFESWRRPDRKLEVLQNWLGEPKRSPCSIRIDETSLAGRKVFVYAGNMGVAQGMGIVLDLAERLAGRPDVGFLFVGRGSDAQHLRNSSVARGLTNVLFFDEIDPDEISDLCAQCHVGIVALDPRHKSHNIPGKFLTYMQNGLPVLANLNLGNDLAGIIRDERVGVVCESNKLEDLAQSAAEVLEQLESDTELSERCRRLFDREFSVDRAVRQIVNALTF